MVGPSAVMLSTVPESVRPSGLARNTANGATSSGSRMAPLKFGELSVGQTHGTEAVHVLHHRFGAGRRRGDGVDADPERRQLSCQDEQ